ncbi:MAG: ATP synthase F1 subunit gamma [Lachnospirales bacterium]
MASVRDIKNRIRSVSSTQKITKAMNLVATSKLQGAKRRQKSTKPFFDTTQRVIASVVKNSKGINHPFLIQREGSRVAVLSISGDRGLCGAYNTNISKEVLALIDGKEEKLVTVGTKARDYFTRRDKNIINTFSGISENPSYESAKEISEILLKLYLDGEVDEVYIGYTEFVTTLEQIPRVKKLLPVDVSAFESDETEEEKEDNSLMQYDPDEETVLAYLVPKYITTFIYGSLVESAACELASRMTSMDSATENATTMIDTLTLKMNRARQSAITQEITEIVSGANALE